MHLFVTSNAFVVRIQLIAIDFSRSRPSRIAVASRMAVREDAGGGRIVDLHRLDPFGPAAASHAIARQISVDQLVLGLLAGQVVDEILGHFGCLRPFTSATVVGMVSVPKVS